MANGKIKIVAWKSWDDERLAKLQGIIGTIDSARFSLESLYGNWGLMTDPDEVIEQLRESHEALGEIFESLEEQRDETDDSKTRTRRRNASLRRADTQGPDDERGDGEV